MNKLALLGALGLLIPLFGQANATNQNLYVSAENSYYNNHFAGSMVVEVVINDPSLSDTSVGKGEPDVTLNGKNLRMVQATDGKWYAYFANLEKAKVADQIVVDAGASAAGKGLDFGEFCSKDTTSFGPSFSESDGITIPRDGATGATNGNSGFSTCTSVPLSTDLFVNNVVRSPKSINNNSPTPGQIGLNPNIWPIIQLYSFNNDVVIQYNAAGGTQTVTLQYDDIQNITTSLDRDNYPPNSQVFVTIKDMQLNQDPTSRDSWTFSVGSTQAVFYEAFTETGANAANPGAGLTNLISKLSNLGFEKNGKLSMNIDSVVQLQPNGYQTIPATDGSGKNFDQIVTFVESQSNTGIFENFDYSDLSNIKILSNVQRGQSASIEYDKKSTSIVSGLNDASIGLGTTQLTSGKKIAVTITDPDQNVNSGTRDSLDVFRSTALIPTLTIGNPITLENAATVQFYTISTAVIGTGTSVTSSVPDKQSDRLVLNPSSPAIPNQVYEKISLNLGITTNDLKNRLITSDDSGTNWINYDFRSLEKQLATDFTDTKISLYFPSDASSVTLLGPGISSQGFVQLDNNAIVTIEGKTGQVFLVIDFDSSDNITNPPGQGITVSSETDTQPIIFDLFSFGKKNNVDVANGIYRFELEETSANSSIFTGTMEYTIANQLNQFDENTIKTMRTIDRDVKFFVNQRLIDEKGINIAYSDLSKPGSTTGVSSKTDIKTHSGVVSINSKTFRFGQPVTIVLEDPDLNLRHDTIDVYSVIDDPASVNVDTVGSSSGGILLEVLIKDIRYKRCTINEVETSGLGGSGFSLIETGPNTGRFEGVFKMPSKICNKSGTALISPAGGIVDVKYHDFRDYSGQPNVTTMSKAPTKQTSTLTSNSKFDSKSYSLPGYGMTKDVVLKGKIQNYKPGTKIKLTLHGPDGKTSTLYAFATKNGNYMTIVSLKHHSLPGQYFVDIEYQKNNVGKISFAVNKK